MEEITVKEAYETLQGMFPDCRVVVHSWAQPIVGDEESRTLLTWGCSIKNEPQRCPTCGIATIDENLLSVVQVYSWEELLELAQSKLAELTADMEERKAA
jgi:hypothetical protein